SKLFLFTLPGGRPWPDVLPASNGFPLLIAHTPQSFCHHETPFFLMFFGDWRPPMIREWTVHSQAAENHTSVHRASTASLAPVVNPSRRPRLRALHRLAGCALRGRYGDRLRTRVALCRSETR